MAKESKISWTEIFPDEYLPSLRWFYGELFPSLILLEPPFWHPDHEQLFKDWQYQSWLNYYEDFPQGYLKLVCLALGLPDDQSKAGSTDPVRFALELIKTVHEKRGSFPADALQSKVVVEFANARLLPLKLAQLVLLNHLVCLLKYKTSIPALITAARTGNRGSMLKLVTIDHIFLEFDPIRNQLRLATLFGKTLFLKPLSKAIATRAAYGDLWEYRDDLFIFLAWHLGFARTGVEQFGFFLWAVGMKQFESTSSLQHKLNRLGISTK
jgi:hypothetical protein